MAIKRSLGERVFRVCNTIFLVLLMIIMAYPIWHVIMASLSDGIELMGHDGLLFWPAGFSTDAYRLMFQTPMIARGYGNTLYIIFFGMILSMAMTILAAFALSRKDLYGRRVFMFLIVFTMYFSGGMIPFYFMVRNLGLSDTRWALIIPTCINTFNFVIMRTSFEALPVSLEESAKLDGATDLGVLTRIVLPLSKPVLAVVALYYLVGMWNSWFNAMLFLRDRNLYPLQLVLRDILIQNDTSSLTAGDTGSDFLGEPLKYATICFATIPILIVYPFLQKYFAKGALVGAVKG